MLTNFGGSRSRQGRRDTLILIVGVLLLALGAIAVIAANRPPMSGSSGGWVFTRSKTATTLDDLDDLTVSASTSWFAWFESQSKASPSVSSPAVVQSTAPPPPPPPAPPLTLFVGISSSPENRWRRDAIRKTWLQAESVKSGRVVVRFFVGHRETPELDTEVTREEDQNQDMVVLPRQEGYYYELVNKTLAIFQYAAEKFPSALFVMKCDDDTFVYLDALLPVLAPLDPRSLYLGRIHVNAAPIRWEHPKWRVTEDEYPDKVYPSYAAGAAYILGGGLVRDLMAEHARGGLSLALKFEDVSMGIWLRHLAKDLGREVNYHHHGLVAIELCAQGVLALHWANPDRLHCMWHKILTGYDNICCWWP